MTDHLPETHPTAEPDAPGHAATAVAAPVAPPAAAEVPVPALIQPTNVQPADVETIARAADLLRAGEVVAFPTETVYGLGADAANPDAVAKIFRLKGRPADHPLIVHLADAARLDEFARDVPEAARRLARDFWPGPLTLVLKRATGVCDAVTGGQDTVGLRVPSHQVARELLAAFQGEAEGRRFVGVAAPSANRFGHVSPTTAMHVFADFKLDVPLILDGGQTEVGIESTIVDLSGERPVLLRPGGVSAAAIERVLGVALERPDAAAPRAPGRHAAHYAPKAKVKLVRRREMLDTLVSHKGRRVAALALEVSVPRLAQALQRVVPAIAVQYAHELYANLRALDAAGADVILIELPPGSAAWTAIHDRLRRAAGQGETRAADAT